MSGIYEAIRLSAEKHREKTAVIAEGRSYTYGELIAVAEGYAAELAEQGISDKDTVAVYRERSDRLIITLLALLKTGAVYVPQSASYPRERVDSIIKTAGCSYLITDSGVEKTGIEAGEHKDAAYMLFTSGSTGTPKGVVTSGNALLAELESCQQKIAYRENDRVLFKAAVNFAFSIYEIYMPLLNGGTVVAVGEDESRDIASLAGYMKRYGITVLPAVPSVLEALMKRRDADEVFAAVRVVMCGGEVLSRKLSDSFISRYKAQIWNIYGMTETTGYITAHLCGTEDRSEVNSVGTPIDGIEYVILDEDMAEVNDGTAGMLYLFEAPMINEYQDISQSRRVVLADGRRAFCTGDIVKRMDGELWFCGRNDNMVKIHGNRVELEEIENQAENLEEVSAAIAGLYKQNSIMLFAESSGAPDEVAEVLRGHLKKHLPAYMVPAVICVVEELHRLPNGKKDRPTQIREYQEMTSTKEQQEDSYGLDALEKCILNIMSEQLGQSAEPDADFYDQGGDSFGMTMMIQQIAEICGIQLSAAEFISASTVRGLARAVEEKRENSTSVLIEETNDKHYEMTEMQLSYFFDRKYAEDGSILPTAGYVELECGGYDSAKFASAVREIVRYHDILRTVFNEDGTQTVIDSAEVVVDEEVLEDESGIETSRKKMLAEQFDPGCPPQMKVRALVRGDGSARIQLYFDAMTADGHSIALMLGELDDIYSGRRTLPDEEKAHFGSYVKYLQKLTDTEGYAEDAAYWEKERKALPNVPELPLKEYSGRVTAEQRRAAFTEEEWHRLEERAKKNGVTAFTVMLTVVGLALKRLTRNSRYLLCLPESIRPESGEFAQTAGVFSNFIYFAFDGTPRPFLQMLRENQKQLLEKKSHSLYKGTEILHASAKESSTLGSGVVSVVMTSLLGSETQLTAFKKVYMESHSSNIPLELVLDRVGGEVSLLVNYISELFDAEMIDGLTETVGAFVKKLTEENCGWEEVQYAPVPVREKEFFGKVSDTGAPQEYCDTATLLRNSMLKNAERTAVAQEDRSITYAELMKKMYSYCAALKSAGADGERPVCILMRKSIEQITAVVACVYSGIPYMPLEEDIPAERLRRCLENSGAKIVFCDTDAQIPAGITVIRPVEINDSAEVFEPVRRSEHDRIAVIHTSGSTGMPKAVCIEHGALQNAVMFTVKRYDVTAADAAMAVTNLAHDMSMFDVFGMLFTGGKIVMPTHEKRKDPMHWLALMEQERVTVWNSVPALMEMFMIYVQQRGIKPELPLRLFFHGGDYVRPTLVKFLFGTFSGCRAVSVGGPTETTLWNIYHDITEEDIEAGFIPYGKPIDGNRYYILDKDRQPIAVGVTGYLYAGGIGVSQGYLGDEALTAEKFAADPITGERLYNTGDLGCYLPDGSIKFMGRDDAQIKINGKRIETEEIAAVIQRCEKVTACEVIGDIQEKRITAFYCASGEVSREVMRDAILRELPEYMMPAAFVKMDRLPLTANGKTDRRALLEKAREMREESGVQSAGLTAEERKLKELYDQYTSNSSYDPDDPFLIAGGNSLKAIQFTFALKEQYGVDIGLAEFFKHSSLRELAEYLKGQGGTAAADEDRDGFVLPSKNGADESEPFPLTELQQAYLVGRKNTMSLNVVTHGYIEAECRDYDHEKLLRVVRRLIKRHGVLRDVISYDNTQHIEPDVPDFEIPVIDLRGRSEKFRQRYLSYVRRTMMLWKLDLDEIPLVRIHVDLLGDSHALLQIYFDTLIIDGAGYTLLYNELEALYEDEDTVLPEIDVTFRDYVMYKVHQKTTSEYEKAKRYWQKRIENMPDAVELPLKQDPDKLGLAQGVVKLCKISMESWYRIKSEAERRGITGFAVLFTVFSEVIARWDRKKRFLLSIPQTDRPAVLKGIEKTLGECATFMLVEVESRPEETFIQTCMRNYEQIIEASENSAFSGVEVLREVYKSKNNYGSALVPVVFSTLTDYEQTERKHFVTLFDETLTSQIWIDIDVRILNGEMTMNWNIPKGLFDEDMIDDMTSIESEMLERLAADYSVWDKRQEIELPERDRKIMSRAVIDEMPIASKSIQARIAESFTKNKERELLAADGEHFTYSQTAAMVRAKMDMMCKAGVKAGDRIAVALGKSAEQVICTLAAVMLGAVYVPFEAEVPAQRLAYCMKNTGCRFIFAENGRGDVYENAVELPSGLDREADDSEITYCDFAGDDLLTIIHTSGSTGQPKAVMVPQRGVRNAIDYTLKKFEIGSDDAVLALTNLAHDMSMFDLFGMILAGGRIVMPAEKNIKDPVCWLDCIKREKVTVWNSVPAMLQMLDKVMEQEKVDKISSIRRLFTGGDYLPVPLMQKLSEKMPKAMLVSVGGPTETTLWNIYHIIKPEDFSKGKIPYGRPIANNRYTIRDENMRIVPAGVTGMMYCTGVGVTAGYCNDMKATSQKYTYDEQGRRMYCTGDLGRYLPDGEIEFMGRDDLQIKINGKRIELAEIERALGEMEGVTAAAAAVSPDRTQIWGYYVCDREYDDAELRAVLADSLPVYMIPKAFMRLEALPLSRTGKIDRKQLPEPERNKESKNRVLTPQAHKLLSLAGEVLGHDDITMEDSFFLAGGDSLSAIVFCKRVEAEFGCAFSLTDIFEAPEFSAILQKLGKGGEKVSAMPQIERQHQEGLPEGTEYTGRISCAQEGIWLHEMFEKDNLFTLTGMCEITGKLNTEMFGEAVQRAVKRYDVLRTEFGEDDNFDPVMNVRTDGSIPLMTQVVAEEQLGNELEKLKALHITLEDKHLAQFRLWVTGEDRYLFIISMHHIICDQATFRLILHTVREEYFRLTAGEKAEEANPIRFCDYAAWERSHELPEESEKFWRDALEGVTETAMPGSVKADTHSEVGMTADVRLDSEEFGRLMRSFDKHHVTRYVGFFTLLTQFLHKITGKQRIAVGSPVSVRNFMGMDDTAGLLVHETVFVSEKAEDISEAFAHDKHMIPETMTHSVLPFELITEKVDSTKKHLPFDLHFNYIEENEEEAQEDKEPKFGALDYVKNRMQHNFGLYAELINSKPLLQLTYKSSYMTAESAEKLAEEFRSYLLGFIDNETEG
ncbi:MAG: amino acid adenylation domain-containing protein [Ruminococcus sp.]|uniref:non-ribosomal peptide synthetase n=1 Tax=Ruminococcus sp. TaxID=41978 RepID=UPI0025CD7C4B|nr:non-ribosomal peptide synthetase [Ruminococcus sp.]MBR0530665.1 amino acid adenylation domain-containing protein [Ruminococcus sp.]